MSWVVRITKQAAKGVQKLPTQERKKLAALAKEIVEKGPVRTNWPNYSKLGEKRRDTHHCHLSYRWVACWEVKDQEIKLVEVYYVGSREDAPY
jgi:mRNA-degrading endonuclease RelE of RelBE toxin-antitoxin system